MLQFVLAMLAVAGCLIVLWVLYYIGEIWRGRHLPKLLTQGLAQESVQLREHQRLRDLLESRVGDLELNLEPAQRLPDRDRRRLVEFALHQWILFDRRQKLTATTREARIHELALVLKENLRGTLPAAAAITKDWPSLATDLAAILCGDDAAKTGN